MMKDLTESNFWTHDYNVTLQSLFIDGEIFYENFPEKVST